MISREFVSVAVVVVVLPLAILSPLQYRSSSPRDDSRVVLRREQQSSEHFGANVIDASVALRSLVADVDISSRDLSRLISEISSVDSSCASDGSRLGLQKVVRVSLKTDSSTPAVVCGAFRAMFGAIAVDSRSSDDAGRIFWSVRGGHVGRAISR
ncbi:ribonuclease III family protein [Actinidia rufa]|uniref:Ribonuclease III family protein n=1 Tax=Actinidia rufa TaxID=165716 RepID=A0A7J0GAF6_9ERIC|nr:ribonuclease III family protein [Actinidia rufa]